MKIFRFGVVVLSLFLVACGGSTQSSDSSAVTTTTTVTQVDCSRAAIEIGVGESTSIFNCSGEWAAIQPSSYVGNCTECESVWLYKWSEAKWNLMGRCNQYVMLVESESPCGAMSGWLNDDNYIDKMADFPPPKVACDIWPMNRYAENVSLTGCTPDPEM
jgi:hypothetical protein